MKLGLKALLLAVAVVFFVIAALDDNFDMLAWGLAIGTAGFLVEALGMDRDLGKMGGPRS